MADALIIAPRGSGFDPGNPAGTVGVQRSTVAVDWLAENASASQVVLYDAHADLYRDLVSGRLDAISIKGPRLMTPHAGRCSVSAFGMERAELFRIDDTHAAPCREIDRQLWRAIVKVTEDGPETDMSILHRVRSRDLRATRRNLELIGR